MSKQIFIAGDSYNDQTGTIIPAAWLNLVFNHRHDGLDQDGSCPLDYAASTGSANAYVLTLPKALTAHIPGLPIHFKTNFANTGAATININGLGAIAIKKNGSTDLVSGDIASGRIVTIAYDGTYYQLLSGTAANEISSHDASSGAHSAAISAHNSSSSAHGVITSVATNGYTITAGGIIRQWGSYTANASDTRLITFPIAFPNAVFYLSHVHAMNGNAWTPRALYSSLAQATMCADTWAAGSDPSGKHYWRAIGY